jgi:hypothetical protein
MACERLTINGTNYVREDTTTKPGKRAVVVIDRGWIYAGDVEHYEDPILGKRLRLTRAVHVFGWKSCGCEVVVDKGKASGADLRPCAGPVDVPADAEIFRRPVGDDWGL